MADAVIITPPPQVAGVTPGGQSQNATDAGATHANVSPGTLVSGTIIGRDPGGNYQLKSPQGTFTLQSSVPLTYNSDVTIRIGTTTAGNTTARIVTVNGESFAEFSTPDPAASDSISTSVQVQAPSTPTTANTLPAVVVAAPAPAGQLAGTQLQEGSNIVIRLNQSDTESPPAQTATSSPPAAQVTTTIQNSVTAATQPQQISQNPQQSNAPAAVGQQQPATPPSPLTTTPAAATVPAVEADVAPEQAVAAAPQTQAQTGQLPQQQTPQVQPSQTTIVEEQPAPTQTPQQAAGVTTQTVPTQSPALQAAAATPQTQTPAQAATQAQTPDVQTQQAQTPSAPVAVLYSAYTKQSATGTAPQAAASSTGTSSTPTTTSTPVPAQITSVDENGMINLSTPLGDVTVKAASLPALSSFTPGTTVTIEVLATTLAQAGNSTPASLSELAGSWQSLKDILGTTTAENPPAATALLSRLPQMGADFASESMAFISSMLQGNARKLLGDDTIETLQQNGRQDLVEKFTAEVSNLSATFSTPPQRQVANWQMLSLPFVYQEALQQARVYVKRDAPKKDKTNAKSTTDTRFVIEADLSEIGSVQMDGLVRRKTQSTAFDLVIRSHQPFSQEDQSQMLSIYSSAAQLTGFKGSLAFQVTRDFPVKPLEEMAGQSGRIITA